MRKLDRTDYMILDILQKDGRIAISELASKVNLSTTPCSERVKRLERDGVITGYYARLNPSYVERNLLVFLEIKLSAKSGDVFDNVAVNLADIPEVLECHLISGEFDYLVKARLKEMGAYRRLLADILKKLPASASSHSYIVMEEIKETLYLDLKRKI
ncbi:MULTISPECIES: Lrp/AsnC ligand binding domain-containing protein [Acinetobacter]|jgi:Lrp/AsnC family transcriptional regulator, leucine-responsive regulatory protein|uniref:Leucine-responsive regulatory protein n=1 Tax=Acinetobacter pollinis TaxID=2605270 RepID=A0ABU6DQF0_9GAMM|nr:MULTISPECIES: Lrp/AsnC ligand binding domain-containing protein [Acinetobacter]MBF7689395.1 Lrp/AsnC ligand binding domain-containing protein [Acinetobacter pollinis]MBF7692042.1 Lrp/AsnC ligand binding domain-containing protein [Acinetobacter pollinis]MBF7697010.1 Lrp/AsnC ligand binding domain-containing protein [Acinetobacter pollinis]MBF7700401.1 Lrp/AsnC ligand binding domain-containing protein [Acinetobacter pollinis]MEB5476099.1 Lrp/AsnC ligand binding domain-containing protein [Acin